MNFEKYTERARGFIQSAQTYALGQGHQQFTPEHVLKVLLDDPEGLASGLIERAGGNRARRAAASSAALAKLPKVSGGGGQLYLGQPLAKVFARPKSLPKKAGDSFVTVERLLSGTCRSTTDAETAKILAKAPASRRPRSMPRSTRCARAAPPIRPPPSRV
jgi:ATP-dependent Clp protease ATP-binding subunit ClpB